MIKPCPHLTELVYCLTRSYWDRRDPVPPNEREILLFALGWGLERLLLIGERKAAAGCSEGIYYSPDFLAFTDLPAELKTTRMSTRRINSAADLPVTWQRQILGYMHCLGVTEYELAILFILGDYKPPFPQLIGYRLSATPEEVASNWQWLLARKELYLTCLAEHIPPPPGHVCEEWECKECRYALRCEAERRKG